MVTTREVKKQDNINKDSRVIISSAADSSTKNRKYICNYCNLVADVKISDDEYLIDH
jgi:hypothetical protein